MSELKNSAKLSLALMDLTSLSPDDNDEAIIALCNQANTSVGNTAAICIFPQFITTAKRTLHEINATDINIATVVNFPHGDDEVEDVVEQTLSAIAAGATEIDVVFPYQALMNGDSQVGLELVKRCKQACEDKSILKVIIESGVLQTPALIKQASMLAIEAGADFIKTSTGKVAVNATLESAEIMLKAIKESGRDVGFKAAGGVKNIEQAQQYLTLANNIMGPNWLDTAHFRFGASSLLTSLLATLEVQPVSATIEGNY